MALGAVRSTVRIVSMATYGTNARVSDIVCLCRRVHYGSVEGSVGVLVESFTTILRKLAAEDFASEKLLRHYAIRRQIESLPAEIVFIFGAPLYCFQKSVFVCLHVRIYLSRWRRRGVR